MTGWEATAEAAQFYKEAVWSMKWKLYDDAREAAESAWALGKHDQESATVRVLSWMPPDFRAYDSGGLHIILTFPTEEQLRLIPIRSDQADSARRPWSFTRISAMPFPWTSSARGQTGTNSALLT